MPPGPPVLSTLVAEIYGPDYQRQRHLALQVRQIFEETEGVVDVDWYLEEDQPRYLVTVDQEKGRPSRHRGGPGIPVRWNWPFPAGQVGLLSTRPMKGRTFPLSSGFPWPIVRVSIVSRPPNCHRPTAA